MELDIGLTIFFMISLPAFLCQNILLTKFQQCVAFRHKQFMATPLTEVIKKNIFDCTGFCGRTSKCSFVVYNWNTKQCSCYEKRDFTAPTMSTSDNTTLYYDGKYYMPNTLFLCICKRKLSMLFRWFQFLE